MKSKPVIWLFAVVGVLWVLLGLRDLFAPGFFSPNGRVVTGSNIALDFALATVFITLAVAMAIRLRRPHGGGQ
jgi:hypothetical protein